MKNKVRIGKDFTIRWAVVTSEGEPYAINADAAILRIYSPYGAKEAIGFIVSGNVIEWVFKGKDQKHLGDYTIELVENNGRDGMVSVDFVEAFTLVAHTNEESLNDEGAVEIQTIELTSQIALAPVTTGGGGGGSYDDTKIKQDIADLQKKDKATDAELAELSEEIGKKVDTDKVATINGQSLVDGGNITIEGGKGEKGDKGDKGDQGNSGYTGAADELEVVNNLTQGGATAALSAEMGKVLGEKSEELNNVIFGQKEEVFQWTDNAYYGVTSSKQIGDVISITPSASAPYSSVLVECSEGDVFLFTGRASSFRPVAFLDSDNKLLPNYGELGTKYKNAEFVAPADSAKVILQVQTSEWNELGAALPKRLGRTGVIEKAEKAASAVLVAPKEYTSEEAKQAFVNLKVDAVSLNNIFAEGNFANPNQWSLRNSTNTILSIENGIAKISYTGVAGERDLRCTCNYTIPANSKVFFGCRFKTPQELLFPSIAFNSPAGFKRLTDSVSLSANSDWALRVFEFDFEAETKLTYFDISFATNRNTAEGDSISYKDVSICVMPLDKSISLDSYMHLMRGQKWFYGDIVIPDYKRLIALDKNLSKDIVVKVGEGGDFDTISAALEYLSEYHTIYKYGGFNAEILILNGTIINEQILVVASDLSWITISYEGYSPSSFKYDDVAESIANGTIVFDETEGFNSVKVDASAWGSAGVTHDTRGDVCLFRAEEGGDLPRINCVFKLINPSAYGTAGVCCNRGASAVVRTLCGFIGFKDGVIANNESSIVIREGITMNCARWGCHARHNGEVSARSIIATGCAYDSAFASENGALVCDRIADLDGREGWASAGTTIFRVANASRMNCNGTHVIGESSAVSSIKITSLSLGNFVQMTMVGRLKVEYTEGAMLTIDSYDMEGEYQFNTLSSKGIIYRD